MAMHGWLTKRGAVFKTWKRRWFVLRSDGTVAYFIRENGFTKGKQGQFVATGATVSLVDSSTTYQRDGCFTVSVAGRGGRTYVLSADTDADRIQFMKWFVEAGAALDDTASMHVQQQQLPNQADQRVSVQILPPVLQGGDHPYMIKRDHTSSILCAHEFSTSNAKAKDVFFVLCGSADPLADDVMLCRRNGLLGKMAALISSSTHIPHYDLLAFESTACKRLLPGLSLFALNSGEVRITGPAAQGTWTINVHSSSGSIDMTSVKSVTAVPNLTHHEIALLWQQCLRTALSSAHMRNRLVPSTENKQHDLVQRLRRVCEGIDHGGVYLHQGWLRKKTRVTGSWPRKYCAVYVNTTTNPPAFELRRFKFKNDEERKAGLASARAADPQGGGPLVESFRTAFPSLLLTDMVDSFDLSHAHVMDIGPLMPWDPRAFALAWDNDSTFHFLCDNANLGLSSVPPSHRNQRASVTGSVLSPAHEQIESRESRVASIGDWIVDRTEPEQLEQPEAQQQSQPQQPLMEEQKLEQGVLQNGAFEVQPKHSLGVVDLGYMLEPELQRRYSQERLGWIAAFNCAIRLARLHEAVRANEVQLATGREDTLARPGPSQSGELHWRHMWQMLKSQQFIPHSPTQRFALWQKLCQFHSRSIAGLNAELESGLGTKILADLTEAEPQWGQIVFDYFGAYVPKLTLGVRASPPQPLTMTSTASATSRSSRSGSSTSKGVAVGTYADLLAEQLAPQLQARTREAHAGRRAEQTHQADVDARKQLLRAEGLPVHLSSTSLSACKLVLLALAHSHADVVYCPQLLTLAAYLMDSEDCVAPNDTCELLHFLLEGSRGPHLVMPFLPTRVAWLFRSFYAVEDMLCEYVSPIASWLWKANAAAEDLLMPHTRPLFEFWRSWVELLWRGALPPLSAIRCVDVLMLEGSVAFFRSFMAVAVQHQRELTRPCAVDMGTLESEKTFVNRLLRVCRSAFDVCMLLQQMEDLPVAMVSPRALRGRMQTPRVFHRDAEEFVHSTTASLPPALDSVVDRVTDEKAPEPHVLPIPYYGWAAQLSKLTAASQSVLQPADSLLVSWIRPQLRNRLSLQRMVEVYASHKHGSSLSMFYTQCEAFREMVEWCFIIIRAVDGDVFGCFTPLPMPETYYLRDQTFMSFDKLADCFFFKLRPLQQAACYAFDAEAAKTGPDCIYTGAHCFYLPDSKSLDLGSAPHGHALHLDRNFRAGSSVACPAFGSPALCHVDGDASRVQDFVISTVEVIGFCATEPE